MIKWVNSKKNIIFIIDIGGGVYEFMRSLLKPFADEGDANKGIKEQHHRYSKVGVSTADCPPPHLLSQS